MSGVSPTISCSCASPDPTRSPTTTIPVAAPYPHLQGLRSRDRGDRIDQREAGPNCTLGVILMRCWEVGDAEHPKVFVDQEAAQAGGVH